MSAGLEAAERAAPPPRALQAWLRGLLGDNFLLVLLAALAIFSVADPSRIARYPSLVDWPTIAALTGLLLLTQGLEASGALQRLGHALIAAMPTERAAALALVASAALLSTLLTNDVALFVVVPLTLGVCRITTLPATRLIIFEALAVNAGSALTPIGNPQNLFLWQLSQVSFGGFVWHMLPLVVLSMAVLLVATACAFAKRPLHAADDTPEPALDRGLLGLSLALYLPFLVAAELHHTGWALAVLLGVFLVQRPRLLAKVDWGLLLVFVLMFIDLRLLAGLGMVREAMLGLGLDQPAHLYLASIAASQVVSNVPATIALTAYSTDWRVIAYGVNVGGFGWMVGSLANLIALRLSGDRRAWIAFHAWAIPALAVAAGLGWLLLWQ